MRKEDKIACFDRMADEYSGHVRRGEYYHRTFEKELRFYVPPGASVLNIGCGTGELLASLKPSRGVGIDISEKTVACAKKRFPDLDIRNGDIESLGPGEVFDYIVITNVIGYVDDIQKALKSLLNVSGPKTRIVIAYFNYMWEPVLRLGEFLGLRTRRPIENWLPIDDMTNLLTLAGFETVKRDHAVLMPVHIPLLSSFFNRYLARLPLLWRFTLNWIIIAKPVGPRLEADKVSCSIVVPCRNEKGNIEDLVKRTPLVGSKTEIIFIEGHSSDGTLEECTRLKYAYPGKNISAYTQDGIGKRDAVYKGFRMAKGDILMILDADLTVAPEDLVKFYEAIVKGQGEFINGSRMVYQMEQQAMRRLNHMANKFFSVAFSYILGQRLRDTLCGTKVLWRSDFDRIMDGRAYFGDFDPFGDFDLIFGAAKLNLKIVEIPVRYRARRYGTTQIERFKHGWLLIKMVVFAMRKIKFP